LDNAARTAPIAEVTEVAEAIVEGDRTRRVAGGQQGLKLESSRAPSTLMLDEQQDLESRLRQFVADRRTSFARRFR